MTPIQTKSAELNAHGMNLGFPLGIEMPLIDGGSFLAHSSGLTIYYHPSVGAHEVHGYILIHYSSLGGPLGQLGYPVSDETYWPEANGRKSEFQNGYIVYNGSTYVKTHFEFAMYNVAARAYAALDLAPSVAKQQILTEENQTEGVNWCGFALANFYRKAGADPAHFPLFSSTLGLLSFGSYYTMDIFGKTIPRARVTKINVNGTWEDLKDYHLFIGSPRKVTLFTELQSGTPLDITPGDIVLFDHTAGAGPDHIQVVYKWEEDIRRLTVIDGNGGGFIDGESLKKEFNVPILIPGTHFILPDPIPQFPGGVSKAEKQLQLSSLLGRSLFLPANQSGHVGVTMHTLTAAKQNNPDPNNPTSPHQRVFAIVRPSKADFEKHTYNSI